MDEMRAADSYAASAANARQLAEIRLHLHRALNCLEVPHGAD